MLNFLVNLQLLVVQTPMQRRISKLMMLAVIGIGCLYLLWYYAVIENEFLDSLKKKYKQQNKEAIQNTKKRKLKKQKKLAHNKKAKIIEPYYTKAFLDNPQNFDLTDFVHNYREKHHIHV